jgi:PAS domain S-box-containing protein
MSKEKIFIVEDETIISMELTHRLIKSDFQIVGTVTSGEEAIKLISSAKPDLILMDILLSGEIDGINAAEEIRKSHDIPIIYITAFADERTLNRAKATEPYGYLIKPFDQKDLKTTIEIALFKHKTELILKDNERWLNSTLKSISDGIICTDEFGFIKLINKVSENIIGLSSENAIGQLIKEFLCLVDYKTKEPVEDPVTRILKLEEDDESPLVFCLKNGNGKFITIETNTTCIKDEKKILKGVVLTFRDISDKKSAEEVLTYRLNMEKLISSISNNFINIPIDKTNEEISLSIESIGQLIEADNCFIYSFSEDQTEMKKLFFWTSGNGLQENDSLKTIQITSFNWALRKLNNNESIYADSAASLPLNAVEELSFYISTKVDSLIIVPLFANKKLYGIFGISSSNKKVFWKEEDTYFLRTAGEIFVNAIQRNNSDQALKESEERLRNLYESMAQGVIYQDNKGKIIFANPAAVKILGVSREKMNEFTSFYSFSEAIHEDGSDFPFDEHPAFLAFKTGKPVEKALLGISNPIEKQRKWIVINSVPEFRQNETNPFRVFSTFTEITELKNVQDELKKSRNELKDLNAAKDKFFSIVAHDLKSPFHGLLGYSSILEESFDELDREEIKRFISHITSATKNLYNLTSQLLTWSRLQTGRMEFNPIKSNLYDIVINVIELLSSNAKIKGIKINNEVGVGTFVKADEMMLNIILENLLSNAIKFSMTGGIITFLIQKEYPEITLCIRDNGIGMQESTLMKLFRIDESHTSKGTLGEEGTGLGLILSKEMTEKMNGKIYIESKLDAGTSVYLTLPAD